MDTVDVERREFLERTEHYRGRAWIVIYHLTFENSRTLGARTVNESHVEHLRRVFTHGCYRLRPENFVPAVVSTEVLTQSLQNSGLQQADLFRDDESHTLTLPDEVAVILLHEKHRILAARKAPIDQ